MAKGLSVFVRMHIGENADARAPRWAGERVAAHARLVGRNDYI